MQTAQSLLAPAKHGVRALMRKYTPGLVRRLGAFHLTDDRRLLESVILAYLRDDPGVKRLLFVGCEWYTKPYEQLFRSKEYWTLEIDSKKRRFGARHHVIDALRNLDRHVPAGYFDAIICNGVFMKTAIETPAEAEPSFATCRDCLRPGGWFVLGWNDTDDLRPYPPSQSPELGKFERVSFPPLGSSEFLTATDYRHTYTFFKKPDGLQR
jgi:SAM-dependent methyltransferase